MVAQRLGLVILLGWPVSVATEPDVSQFHAEGDQGSEAIDFNDKDHESEYVGSDDMEMSMDESDPVAEFQPGEHNVDQGEPWGAHGQKLFEQMPHDMKQLTGPQLQNLHGKLDLNKDGNVSLSELIQYAQRRHLKTAHQDAKAILLSMDLDHDGKLSPKEIADDMDALLDSDFQAVVNDTALGGSLMERTKKLEKKKFEAADKDRDGLLNEQEITYMFFPETDPDTMDVQIKDLFDQHDCDGNGKIDLSEFSGGDEQPSQANPEINDVFKGLDQDGDGQLSAEELKPWSDGSFSMKKLFGEVISAADQDNDEHVTLEELQEAGNAGKIGPAMQLQLKEWALHEEF